MTTTTARHGGRPIIERPLARPVGVKLELTYRCNLRCGFCYTDSPRRTLERAVDLTDEDWLRIVDEAIELGVIEAVVTGGEPLLRRELTLQVLERLDAAGMGVSFNTNGWFVSPEIADRLARLEGLHVHISIDGATPELHDASRGVPGSWRRAVGAMQMLIERGARVQVVHVVTPENQERVTTFLDEMWLLGLRGVRITPVVKVGAAVDGEWAVNERALRRRVHEFRTRRGEEMRTPLQSSEPALLPATGSHPATLLVRPNGAVLLDSLHPFKFGDAREQGLAECWARLSRAWRHPAISHWAGKGTITSPVAEGRLIPYRDEEVAVAPDEAPEAAAPVWPRRSISARVAGKMRRTVERARSLRSERLPEPPSLDEAERRARGHVVTLALSRRYESAVLRSTGARDGERFVRVVADGRVCRLNGTAALILDSCDGGTPGEAVDALAARHPRVPRETLEEDVLTMVRWLLSRGVIRPSGAPVRAHDPLASVADLPGLDPGQA
jgi:MoaA/NifB/PqqE/SkfB family radical SAM enzyme